MDAFELPNACTSELKDADTNIQSNGLSSNIHSLDKAKPRNSIKSKNCSYFYNNGYCKFGNDCKYKHSKKRSEISDNTAENTNSPPQNSQVTKSKRNRKPKAPPASKNEVCKYFMLGDCKKGDYCEYLHSVDLANDKMADLALSSQSQSTSKKVYSSSRSSKKRTLCYYYKKGLCYKGESCNYYHPRKLPLDKSDHLNNFLLEDKDANSSSLSDKNAKYMKETFPIGRNNPNLRRTFNVYDLSSLSEDAISELRATEIGQLKKRFPQFEIITENLIYSILFQPSDPDWAFDVKKLKLEVEFPEKYPTEKCRISVIRSAENIPLILIKHLNNAISQWIKKKFEENYGANKTELMFRSFLKWFDKSLEDLFIAGLKKVKQDIKAKEAGIEFVPVEKLFPDNTDGENDSSENNSPPSPELDMKNSTSTTENSNIVAHTNKPSAIDGNNVMKITFTSLEFVEGTAAFICTKISVTLQCFRCKTSFNLKSLPKRNNFLACSKCSKNVGFTFEPSTVHQFSSVLGTLHLLDCVAVDINVVDSQFLIDCLNCSKQVPAEGIQYGQKHKMWCLFCNTKLVISIGSVKFQTLKSASLSDNKYSSAAKKTEKKIKDPVVKEGDPLPDFGACKHYKKSFRWLRFPCCGRLYACDECHDEKELDHEMKYASRMLCGFCAKEQPYSREKPCLFCSHNLTKKSGCHWEGGKGCRNRIQMSREDKQKYSGVTKTISKKSQSGKSKKK